VVIEVTLSSCHRSSSVAVMADRPLSAEAKVILRYAVVADLRSDCDELAALVRETLQPIPTLPADPALRASMLLVLLLQARDRTRRLLAQVASPSRSDPV
jgi:hypothetical protein